MGGFHTTREEGLGIDIGIRGVGEGGDCPPRYLVLEKQIWS